MVYEKFTVSHMLGPQVLNDLNLYNKIKIWTGLPERNSFHNLKIQWNLQKHLKK